MKKAIITAAFAAVAALAGAQTIHSIVFCHTTDASIGRPMTTEMANLKKQIGVIESCLDDYAAERTFLDGPMCTRENLKKVIDEMEIEEEDIVLTFYGGHGAHAANDSDPWPQYCMNVPTAAGQNSWVPMALLANWLKAKPTQPRLTVILSNCCNSVSPMVTRKPLWAMGGDYTSLDNIKPENIRTLFSGKGVVMMTSSRVPEPSWCNDMTGGLFTTDFVEVLDRVGKGSVAPRLEERLPKDLRPLQCPRHPRPRQRRAQAASLLSSQHGHLDAPQA